MACKPHRKRGERGLCRWSLVAPGHSLLYVCQRRDGPNAYWLATGRAVSAIGGGPYDARAYPAS
jgi:hypothetical protein